MRTEKDAFGSLEIPAEALYGIHSARAKENFPVTAPFHIDWFRAVGKVKLACYESYGKFREAVEKNYPAYLSRLNPIEKKSLDALCKSATEVSQGDHYNHCIVPAVQGGAGTSINMNINEIICNRALQLLNSKPGNYESLDPIEHANIYQSTNDVIPSSLVVATMEKLMKLEDLINNSRGQTEKLETRYRNSLRLGYTQLQAAIPSTWGTLFSSYSDALSRDWWRVSKAFERIKQVNLGGGAIGTGLSLPRFYIMEVVPALKKLTGLPLSQAENMSDATSNLDSWVEIHAILKAHAVNMEKISSDLRLLASSLTHPVELKIPGRQTGSSIMPGKVNPVIPEFIVSSSHKIFANDQLITSLCGQGNLELNAYLPVIGNAILESLDLLIAMNLSLRENLLEGIEIDEEVSFKKVIMSPAVAIVLNPIIGYHKAAILSKKMKEDQIDVFSANEKLKLIEKDVLEELLQPSRLLQKGFTMKDVVKFAPKNKQTE